ncbi:MAG TPA: hypothetical protein VD927_12260 [Chryseosolibacter sp.]|nr:hypothetical protein [Chryseosolibacter sp.]
MKTILFAFICLPFAAFAQVLSKDETTKKYYAKKVVEVNGTQRELLAKSNSFLMQRFPAKTIQFDSINYSLIGAGEFTPAVPAHFLDEI